jgi:hypothetical protein
MDIAGIGENHHTIRAEFLTVNAFAAAIISSAVFQSAAQSHRATHRFIAFGFPDSG